MPKQALIITEFSKDSIGAFGNRAMFEIAEKMWLIVKGTHKKVENSTIGSDLPPHIPTGKSVEYFPQFEKNAKTWSNMA